MALRPLGFTIRSVEDGIAAWEAIRCEEQHYDLLITDNEMPRLNGLELAQRLKSACSPLPVIMISGSVGEGRNYSEYGIQIALPKPCSLEEIKKAIFSILLISKETTRQSIGGQGMPCERKVSPCIGSNCRA